MKTYLTPAQFSRLFYKAYEHQMHTANPSVSDRVIWSMFKEYKNDVKAALECALHGIEDFTGPKPIELIGYQFHKSFRQTDVIDSPHISGIVWICLQDAPIFWECMELACHALVNETGRSVYKEIAFE